MAGAPPKTTGPRASFGAVVLCCTKVGFEELILLAPAANKAEAWELILLRQVAEY
jgi:hypothetical protein